MKKLLLGGIALLITPLAVLAADMYKAPPPPLWNWAGFYVGGELGAKWMQSRWNTTSLFNAPNSPITMIDTSSPRVFRASDLRAGGYVGHNWQFAPQWVAGYELDIAYADKIATAVGVPGCTILCTAPFAGVTVGPDQSSVRMLWDASARARLGFLATPDALVYVTGGAAWQRIKTSATCQHTGPDPFCLLVSGNPIVTATDTFTRVGWTAGGGVDWRIYGNWIARAEYRYSLFGNRNSLLNLSVPPVLTTVGYQLKASTNIATFGLAYKFGGPVVASY
jgi:outer membrane immunogenic protein